VMEMFADEVSFAAAAPAEETDFTELAPEADELFLSPPQAVSVRAPPATVAARTASPRRREIPASLGSLGMPWCGGFTSVSIYVVCERTPCS
jgi:hypothetical protein